MLGSDTVVVVDGAVFGKPTDRVEGPAYAERLVGTHASSADGRGAGHRGQPCRAGTELYGGDQRGITAAEAAAYWETGEPQGKAGGYAIQGRGAQFIAHISGSYSGVNGPAAV